MGIRDILFGKKQMPAGAGVFSINANIHPFRLPANKADYVQLDLTVTNNFDKELLSSVVIRVPKALGFEQSALSHEKEIRIGQLGPRESKSLRLFVWGTGRTDPGAYPVEIFALSHYRDYSYVLNEARKTLELRAA